MPLYKRADSPYWWVRIGRKTRCSTGATNRAQAEEFERTLQQRLWRLERLGDRGAVPWASAVERYLNENAKPKRRDRELLGWLAKKVGECPLYEFADADAIEKIRKLGALDGPNPAHGLWIPKERGRARYVTDAEYLGVRGLAHPMVRHAMDLALLCGMDRATVLSLERRNVTDAGIEFERRKTRGLQRVAWSEDLREVVDAVLREPPRLRQALICTRRGHRYTPDGFSALWQRAMAAYVRSGGERYTFHDIRAKSASDSGSDQEAADRLGHGDPSITRRVYRRLPKLAQPLAWRGKNDKA